MWLLWSCRDDLSLSIYAAQSWCGSEFQPWAAPAGRVPGHGQDDELPCLSYQWEGGLTMRQIMRTSELFTELF